MNAVTSHPIPQKMASQQESRDCGIFLGAFPNDLDFKSLAGRTRQKESGVLSFPSFHRTEKRDLFPPAEHREIGQKAFPGNGKSALRAFPRTMQYIQASDSDNT